MRTYYCKCGISTEVSNGDIKQCKCGNVFGSGYKASHYINMRNTLSGTTKMEFNTTTVDESVKRMNASK